MEEALLNELIAGAVGSGSPLALGVAIWYVVNRMKDKNGNGHSSELKDLAAKVDSVGRHVGRIEGAVGKIEGTVASNHDDLVRFMAEMSHLNKDQEKLDGRLSKVEQHLYQK